MFSKSAHFKDTFRASLALAACVLILGVFVIILGGFRFWETLDLYTLRFQSVKDLSTGRPVKYGGLDVGRILAIGVDPDDPRMIRVTIGLRERIHLHQGVVARIAQKGLVGDYYVFLDPQGQPGHVIPPGSILPTAESVDMSQLAGLAGEFLRDLRPRLEHITQNIEALLNQENTQRISDLLIKTPVLVDELRKTAAQVQKDFSTLAGSGKGAAEAARQTLNALNASTGKLTGELERTLADVRAEVHQVGVLTGDMHKAVRYDQAQLEDILENVERVSTDLKHLAAKLRDRPWEAISPPKERLPRPSQPTRGTP